MKKPDVSDRRAQFQLWIFSYHIFSHSPKKCLSRVLLGGSSRRGARCQRVTRMEPSGLAFGKPKDRLRVIRDQRVPS
jgi:hypothetical protein